MSRAAALSLVALLPILALASRAQAQAFSSSATISVNGEKLKNNSIVYINRAQCQGTFTFDLIGYGAAAVPYLELWVANSKDVNCADAANRATPTAGSNSVCWQVGEPRTNVRGTERFENVPGDQIFDYNRDGKCDENEGNIYKVQFVTLASATLPNSPTVAQSNNHPNQISAIFTLYSKPPAAPSNPRGDSGEKKISISYDRANNDPLTRYRGFLDTNGMAGMDGGVCTSTALSRTVDDGDGGTRPLTGIEVELDNENVFASGRTDGTSVTFGDLDKKGIEIGDSVALSVVTIDAAGNEGYLSDPICVTRQNVESFIDQCNKPGTDCGLESCSLSPRNTGSALALSACTLAISAWLRRRRRST